MGDFTALDPCDNLEAVASCDVHRFRQFVEVQRRDKRGSKATYPGLGDALKRRHKSGKPDRYIDQITRATNLAGQLGDRGFGFGHFYALAGHEQELGLPASGRRRNPDDRRLEFLYGLGPAGTPSPQSRIGVPPRGAAAHGGLHGGLPVGVGNVFDALRGVLGQFPLLPMPADADPADRPTWAIGVDYEQEWCSLGYGRGRLIRSIPLTPNETVEIITKTWDKRTERRQDLQSAERDVSTEFIGDEKWSLATRKELTASLNGSVNGNLQQHADISLPIDIVEVSAGSQSGIGGTLGGSLTQTVAETTEHVTQETVKSADRLKTTVTSTVETVSDVGREVTQTQKLTNPNRCHSVTYHFVEIAERYRIRTRPVGAAPYLLVPLDRPEITYGWVLCHECELKALLPCESYYAGFQAAKVLKARENLGQFLGSLDAPGIESAAGSLIAVLENVVSIYQELSRAGLVTAGTATGVLNGVMGLLDALRQFAQDAAATGQDVVDAVVDTGEQVLDAIIETGGELLGQLGAALGFSAQAAPPGARSLSVVGGEGGGGAGSLIYWEIVKVMAPELEAALAALAERAATVSAMPDGPEKTRAAFDAANAFLTQAGDLQGTFDRINMVAGAISFGVPFTVAASRLGGLGLPGVVLSALLTLLAVGFAAVADGVDAADLLPDDEGLEAAILQLQGQLQSLGAVSLLPAAPGPDASKEAIARYERLVQEMKREQLEVAYARVEFDRLQCHLQENFEYYNQALWLGKPTSALEGLLQTYHVPLQLVSQRIEGFVRNRAAFRVNEALMAADFDWRKEFHRLELDALFDAPPVEVEVDMPTPGMTVEPALGRCDGCDEFVGRHRELDLENRAAEVALAVANAEQAQVEARRLFERVEAGDLSDPTPFESPQTRLHVEADDDGP